ncbi:MAG: prolipoprotein diacylglyceryl transferase [Candidatus Aureabacteria bacterium]|nr:prolipoprotein diacylglyceryl transferase [Candidatus Auribacterota bacterium]
MHPIAFKILGLNIYSYGLFMAIGILTSVWIASTIGKRENLATDTVYDFCFIIVIFALLGSRILYVIVNLKYFINNPVEVLFLNRGGFIYYGGFIGGFAAAIFYLKKNKLPLWGMGDIICCVLPLGQAFGRLGCFLNGCCFGKPGLYHWCVQFRSGLPFEHYQEFVPIHPVQLYNAALNFIIFLVLYFIFEDKKFNGLIIVLYGVLYSFSRFITEFYRGDVPLLGSFTLAQWTSIIIFILSIFLYQHLSQKYQKHLEISEPHISKEPK